MMDCRRMQEQLDVLAIQSPDVPLPDEIRTHLEKCESCQTQLRELREAWLLLPASLERGSGNEAMENALMERIATDTSTAAGPSPVPAIGRYVVAAMVLIGLLAGSYIVTSLWSGEGGGDDPEITLEEDKSRHTNNLGHLRDVFAAPSLQFLSLEAVNASRQLQGYLVYDLAGREGHFFGFGLHTSKQQVFKLWLLDESGDVVSSATVNVADDELGSTVVSLPEDLSVLHEATITAESQADAVRPSSEVIMRARIAP